MEVLLIVGAVQALFFFILILNKRGKRMPDILLAFSLIIFAVHLSAVYFLFKQGYSAYINYGSYVSGIIILYFSLMYIYARSLISNNNTFSPKWLLHLLPTIITYISFIPYMVLDYEGKMALFDHKFSNNFFFNFTAITIISFITYYIIIIFRLLRKHEINIKKTFSYDENINLAWLKKLAIILAVIWVVFSISTIYVYYRELTSVSEINPMEFYIQIELYGHCLFVGFVYLLGYFGYKQGNIFLFKKQNSNIVETGKADKQNDSISTDVNTETKSEDIAFVDVLNKYMTEQKPYLESELSLFQLAKELNVSTHYLSNILNNYIHKNFYEFINHYRVDEVKRKIVSNKNDNFTLLAIALDCGFNSKATFNRIFKNYTGYTPSQFHQEYK